MLRPPRRPEREAKAAMRVYRGLSAAFEPLERLIVKFRGVLPLAAPPERAAGREPFGQAARGAGPNL